MKVNIESLRRSEIWDPKIFFVILQFVLAVSIGHCHEH